MPILNRLSGAFPAALIYITVGVLIDIWTIVLWVYNEPETRVGHIWLVGFLLTGLALFVIGMFLGPIGRSARIAELPPSEVTPAAAQSEQNAAARAPIVVPAATAVPGTVASAPAPVALGRPTPAQALK